MYVYDRFRQIATIWPCCPPANKLTGVIEAVVVVVVVDKGHVAFSFSVDVAPLVSSFSSPSEKETIEPITAAMRGFKSALELASREHGNECLRGI